MTTLYLTRHGETIWNTQRRMQGWKDSKLTENGLKQTQLLAKKLESVEFDAIYSSPLPRTMKTAQILKGHRTLDIFIEENLKEINLGIWEGKIKEELLEKDQEQVENFWYKPHLYLPPEDGETLEELIGRTSEGINKIITKHKNETILVVTHGAALKAIMFNFMELTLDRFWEPPMIYQTSLTKIEIDDDGRAEVVMYADISHYEQEG